ncbi:hypothetical protein PZ892_04945 [Sphingobacterium sp. WM]|uniref:hypothetical protein n=1 Tax=Sphingobacterium sp. WM TaxID=3031802 RepID=UPI00240D534A|nr:hypothetical protein [Sphingobacterium sp. WM]WFB64554.1 hypothetical protein PZ892_04945 [Sphingobacterium sp. WM]
MQIKPIQKHNLYAYRRLRRAIGYLGIFLPTILVLLSLIKFFTTKIQPSISHYYYTNLREIFTGTLCAVGLFLICYKGNGNKSILKNDNLLTNIAGMMAFGVAFIPTDPISDSCLKCTLINFSLTWLHYAFAGVLFLIFALLSINVFTIGQQKNTDIPVSMFNENKIYRFCGYAIIICVVLVPLKLFPYSTLVFEALALWMFGISWLIKGRALGDEGVIGEKIYREHNTIDTEKAVN